MFIRKGRKFSAYLSIYNDWDILAPALKSVAPYVDELVVVDGAYDWMVPYLKDQGIDPIRSNEKVYQAIKSSGIPFRTINRTWFNEIEKRRAGYEACSHRYVYRVDADEIIFFDDNQLRLFFWRKEAIAEMEMPLYAAPGWIVRRDDQKNMPCQCFLFDRQKVSADIHLNYLWLVLTADELPDAGKMPFPIYEKPIAFNAHLTHWRTPETAVNRGVFYVLNWMRQNGVTWLSDMAGKPVKDFREVFNRFPAAAFREAQLRGSFPMGTWYLQPNERLDPTPLEANKENQIKGLHDNFLKKLAEQNSQSAIKPQTVIYGESNFIDISTPAARQAMAGQGNKVILKFSSPLSSANVKLHTVASVIPQYGVEDLTPSLSERTLSFELPMVSSSAKGVLRQVIELVCAGEEVPPMSTYLVVS